MAADATEHGADPPAEDANQADVRVSSSVPWQRLGNTKAPLLFRLLFDEPHFRAMRIQRDGARERL